MHARAFVLCIAAAALPRLAAANGPAAAPPLLTAWLQAPAIAQRLAAGDVVNQSHLDDHQAGAHIDAAIRIHAHAAAIWPLITRCRFAAVLAPQVHGCRTLQSAADGSWAVIEHDIRYSLLSPVVHSVFRADFRAPYQMDFHRISGDLKSEVGSWRLTPSPDGQWTTVEYQVAVQTAFWLPRGLVRHSLAKQLPAALLALRGAAEQASAAAVAATGIANAGSSTRAQ